MMEQSNSGIWNLESLGWDSFFAQAFEPFAGRELVAARVALQHRTHYIVFSEHGELKAEAAGKMLFHAEGMQDLPAVGDWVVIHPRPEEQAATILEILPRRTKFSRKTAGRRTEEQIVASNVDVVFIVSGLDGDFNVRRLERYLVLVTQSGASPVIVLNKADACANIEELKNEVQRVAGKTPIHITSALRDEGLDMILNNVKRGQTGALMGSSGVGKTTIINHLLGSDERKTEEVRETDSRGRHATTVRELILLPSGGLLIDTPGMRELQLWGEVDGVEEVFDDIEELAGRCKFRDCSHEVEPGCAVREALESGSLDSDRYESYQKLLRELAYHSRKSNEAEQRKEKERIKKIMTQYKKNRPRR